MYDWVSEPAFHGNKLACSQSTGRHICQDNHWKQCNMGNQITTSKTLSIIKRLFLLSLINEVAMSLAVAFAQCEYMPKGTFIGFNNDK